MLISHTSKLKNKNQKVNKIENKVEYSLTQITVADSLVKMLYDLGICHAFGVSGGAIAPIWEALEKSPIEVLHFRHEAGAAFAAMESYFANNRPVAVFTTTGPGLTNALTGITAARWEGAKVILLSACTSTEHQGKWEFQETGLNTMPEDFFKSGSLFHYAQQITSSDDLGEINHQLQEGCNNLGAFIAHISTPTTIQIKSANKISISKPTEKIFHPEVKLATQITKTSKILSNKPFTIWVGFGARDASDEILQLAERTGALVMSSPRGKGIFPEKHPQYLGVTGFAGHDVVLEYMHSVRPENLLVLGTRLGEFTSFWNQEMLPADTLIHVDINPSIPGAAFPEANTLPICADIKIFLQELLKKLPKKMNWSPPIKVDCKIDENGQKEKSHIDCVRPRILMKAIQELIIDTNQATIIAEAGNSFAWTTHCLKFSQSKQWRVSTGFGAMGNATTGVLGISIANSAKAVAIVGDGAMLMNNEINTAVKYNLPVVWIVLNDARYNMCAQGMKKLGYNNAKPEIHPTDFVMLARSMGANGISVNNESQLELALLKAMNAEVPFIIDVKVDYSEQAPIGKRIISLIGE